MGAIEGFYEYLSVPRPAPPRNRRPANIQTNGGCSGFGFYAEYWTHGSQNDATGNDTNGYRMRGCS